MKFRNLILGIAAIAFPVISCQNPAEDQKPEQAVVTVDKEAVSFSHEKSEETIHVSANTSWTAESDAEWLLVSPESGKGDADMTIYAEANDSESAREAKLSVKSEDATVTRVVTISQSGKPGPEPVVVKDVTVAEFLAAEVSETQLYRLSGKMHGPINTQYGNFDLEDATGTVYVYGLSNVAEYASQLLENADVVVVGYRGYYEKGDKIEMVNGTLESISGGDPVEPVDPVEPTGKYNSSVTWTLGPNSYDGTLEGTSRQTATINGEYVDNLLKLGKSKEAGSATLHIPAGTISVAFYAYAWNNTEATLKITVGSNELTVDLKSNPGAAGNPEYNITASDEDLLVLTFSKALSEDVDMELTTTTVARALLFGINAYDRVLENYTLDDINALDYYIMDFGGIYYNMIDLYVSDYEANSFSFNLDICGFLLTEEQLVLNGTYDIDECVYRDNERNEYVMENCVATFARMAGHDHEGYPYYSASFSATLDNGEPFEHTFKVRVIAVDDNFEEVTLQDEEPATKTAFTVGHISNSAAHKLQFNRR